MKVSSLAILCMFFVFAAGMPHANEGSQASITSHRNWDWITDVGSRGNLIAIGAMCGLVVLDNGQMSFLTTENGMPFGQLGRVDVAPDGAVWVSGRGLCCYFDGSLMEVDLPDPIVSPYNIAAVSRNEVWFTARLSVFNWKNGTITAIEAPGSGRGFLVEGSQVLLIDGGTGKLYRLEEDQLTWTEVPGVLGNILSRGNEGRIYVAGRHGLWCSSDGSTWLQLDDDDVWDQVSEYPGGLKGVAEAEDGVVWACGAGGLLRWTPDGYELFTEAAGISLVFDYCYPNAVGAVVVGVVALPSGILVGTGSDGLLFYDGSQFSLVKTSQGPPGNVVTGLGEDSSGSIWTGPYHCEGPGRFDGFAWESFPSASTLFPIGSTSIVLDVRACLHFCKRHPHLVTYDGEAFIVQNVYDHGITECVPVQAVPACDSTLWVGFDSLGYPPSSEAWAGAVRITPSSWDLFDNESFFFKGQQGYERDQAPTIVGGQNCTWFVQGSLISRFEEGSWTDFFMPPPVPFEHSGVTDIVMDLHHRLVFCCTTGIYRLHMDRWMWDRWFPEAVSRPLFDSDGVLWGLAAGWTEVIRIDEGGQISRFGIRDGLADSSVESLTIDHNGDKWVGTCGGLSRIDDGGPAKQKLELAVEEAPDGYLTVSGTFTNAGAVIPVLLWLACEYEGTLYYYPAWGPTPEGTKRVLGAYSIETEELLRLDTSTLPPGDYTFYGGISLLGGMDLLIGARGAKIAVTTYHKE